MTQNPPAYLTVEECAELLRTTAKAVRLMIDRGALPGVRRPPGLRKVLIHRASVVAWLESGASSLHTR